MKTKKRRRRRGGGRIGDFFTWIRKKVRGNYDDHKWDKKKTKKKTKKKYYSNENPFLNKDTGRSTPPPPPLFSENLAQPLEEETGFYSPRKNKLDIDQIRSKEARNETGFFQKSKEEKKMELEQSRKRLLNQMEKQKTYAQNSNTSNGNTGNSFSNLAKSTRSYGNSPNSVGGRRRRKRNRRKRRTRKRSKRRRRRRSRRRSRNR